MKYKTVALTLFEADTLEQALPRFSEHNSAYEAFLRLKETECDGVHFEVHKVPEILVENGKVKSFSEASWKKLLSSQQDILGR